MESRLLIALGLVVVAVAVALWLERRRPDAPTGGAGPVPRQLDRDDFVEPEKPWLVVLFSSRTCDSCADVAAKLRPLHSEAVAVQDVEFSVAPDLHRRYRVDAVPLTLVADAEGVVRAAFTGKVSATDLWASVAEAREPGSSPEPDLGGR